MYGSIFGGRNISTNENTMDVQNRLPIIGNELPMDPEHKLSSAETPLVDTRPDQLTGAEATIWSGFINLTNTIVGAGMLGLPGAFSGTGFVGGTILIVLGAMFSAHGLVLLSKAAQRTGLPSSFYSVACAAIPQYTILIDLAVALKCFGVATGYLITVGNCMVDALDHLLLNGDPDHDSSLALRIILSRQCWVVGAVLAVMPFSFFRKLDDLKKTSALALVFVFFLAFGIIAYANGLAAPCPEEEGGCQGEIVAFTDGPTTLSKLPIFIFAFTCHQNIFPIVNELHNRTQERLNLVIVVSIGSALVLFYVVAMEGYFTFGANVRGDILLNYPENGYVTILRICIAVMLTLHYPLQLDPSRRCISSLIKVVTQWRHDRSNRLCHRSVLNVECDDPREVSGDEVATKPSHDHANHDAYDNVDGKDRPGDDLFYEITVSFLLFSFLVAMIVDDLGVVLAMVGATGSTLVSYILPGLIYVKIHRELDASKIMGYVQLMVGCLIMPVALYFVILGKVQH